MVFLDGHGIGVPDERGQPLVDETFLIVFHAAPDDATFTLPDGKYGKSWRCVFDTARGFVTGEALAAGAQIAVVAKSVWLLRREG
jgi:glycogen operon protein